MSEGDFYCVHTIQFSEPTKIRSLKSNRVNGHLRKLTLEESQVRHEQVYKGGLSKFNTLLLIKITMDVVQICERL